MKIKYIITFLAAVGLGMTSYNATAQESLFWFNDAQQEGPMDDDIGYDADASEFIPTDTDPLLGALVQLIHDVGGDGADSIPDFPNPVGNGVQDDDALVIQSFAGKGGTAAGTFFDSDSLANYGLLNTDSVYVRLFDRPSQNGTDILPSGMDYTGQTIINYPEAAVPGVQGFFYIDGPVAVINTLPGGGGIFNYTFPSSTSFGESSWDFVPTVPEPSTLVMACLGFLGLYIRKRKKA